MRTHWRFHELRVWLISSVWIWVLHLFLSAPERIHAQPLSYSIQLQPGFNSIANHLVNGANRLDDILRDMPDGSELYKYDPATQNYYRPAVFLGGYGWFPEDPQTDYLNPGEGAFLRVPGSNIVTFSGSIAQIALPRSAVFGGYNFVSAHEPRTMSFIELFGFPPADGDVVYLYDHPFTVSPDQSGQGASSVHKFTSARGWDTIAPLFKRGRSAFVYLSRAPRIIVQPKSQAISAGQTLRLDASLLGTGPVLYQWQFNDDDIPGETNAFLMLSNIQFLQAGLYSVTVRNSAGETTSKPASIRVSSPPVILDPPQPMRAIPGQLIEFHVRAVGTPPLRYQWIENNQPMPNGIEPLLKVVATRSAPYQVRVTNPLGSVQSDPVLLEVNDPPSILEQPASQTIFPHENTMFAVTAKGTPPLRYQWTHNGVNIRDETNATLMIRDARPANSGFYQVKVGNIAGAVHSDPAELIVVVPPLFLADRAQDSQTFSAPVFTGRGDNLRASNEVDELHCTRKGGSSVWLRWFSKDRGIVQFETSGSTFDTVLAAYTMDATGRMIGVVCDDDEGEFLGSRIRFAAAPETIYFIAIDGVDGARGHILLDWQLEPTFEFLPVILEQPRDQVAAFAQSATFFVQVTGNPTFYQWYHNDFPVPGANGSRLVLDAVKDSDLGYYYVDVFQERQSVRSRRALLQISLADADNRLIQGFAVDKFADALNRQSSTGGGIHSLSGTAFTPVIGYTGTQIFSTVGFGGEPGELSHCGIPGGSSAWFTFIAPTNGRLYLDTSGSSFNTVLAVYTGPGPTITNLTALICDNDSGPGTTSSLNFSAAKNVTYYIAVDGFNGVTGTAHLNYRLLVPMTLSRVLKTNDTDCRLRVTATPSYPLTIQRCSGFQTWANVITITNPGSGTYDYRDTNATIIRRFYRAIQTP